MIRSIKCIHLIIIQINFEEEWVFEKIKKWEWGKKWMNDNNKTTQIVTHTCAFAQWSKSPHFTHHFTSLHSYLLELFSSHFTSICLLASYTYCTIPCLTSFLPPNWRFLQQSVTFILFCFVTFLRSTCYSPLTCLSQNERVGCIYYVS